MEVSKPLKIASHEEQLSLRRLGRCCFETGSFKESKKAFLAAKELSDRGRSVEYARWIRKCDVEIEEQEKEKKLVNIVPPRPYAITSPSSSRIVIPRLSHSGIVSGPQMPKYQYY